MNNQPHAQSNREYPTEAAVKKLRQRVRQFRRDWAGFAVKSQDVWDSFRSEGASLTEQFLDGIAELENGKHELYEEISLSTAAVGEHVWQRPERTESLQSIEDSLSALVKICQEREAELRQQRLEHASVVRAFLRLRVNEAALEREWSEAAARATALAEEIELSALISEAALQARTAPYRSFHVLVQDALQRQATHGSGDAAPASGTEFSDVAQAFQEVAEQFGEMFALAAIGGRVQVEDTPLSDATAGEAVVGAEKKATQGQINALVENFSGSPGTAVRSGVVSAVPLTVNRSAPPEVDFSSLPDWADSLRWKALNVKLQAGPDAGTRDSVAAAGYINLAAAIDAVVRILAARNGDCGLFRSHLHDALKLLAEAQNAVRVHHQSLRSETPDVPEQTSIFYWLKEITDEEAEALPIEQYMRLSDRADPLNHADLADRLNRFMQKWNRDARRSDLLDAVRRAVANLPKEENQRRWKQLDDAVSAFVGDGWKTNDAELREALLPLADDFGITDEQELSTAFELAMENVANFLDAQLSTEMARTVKVKQLPEHVQQASALLRGKTVALVGGTEKPEARGRIESALQLRELVWIPASKQDRVADLEPRLRNASLVILVTALIGHKHNAMRETCCRKGIPWVQMRKSAGYGVNQLADAILKQASVELTRAS